MRFYIVFIKISIILLFLMMFSCGRNSIENGELDYQMTDWNREHPDCETDEEPCVSLSFTYPEFHGKQPLSDSLQCWINQRILGPEADSFKKDNHHLAQEWFDDYDQYSGSIEDYRIPWSLERRIEMIFQSSNLISLHFNEFSFTGGAHPMQIDIFQSFEESSGNKIVLSDLTYDDHLFQQLTELAEEQFRFTYELLENENLDDAGFYFLDGTFNLPENFAFTEFGILFYYNVYEVAPYATRPIAIELPYRDLKNIVRSRWLEHEEQFTYR